MRQDPKHYFVRKLVCSAPHVLSQIDFETLLHFQTYFLCSIPPPPFTGRGLAETLMLKKSKSRALLSTQNYLHILWIAVMYLNIHVLTSLPRSLSSNYMHTCFKLAATSKASFRVQHHRASAKANNPAGGPLLSQRPLALLLLLAAACSHVLYKYASSDKNREQQPLLGLLLTSGQLRPIGTHMGSHDSSKKANTGQILPRASQNLEQIVRQVFGGCLYLCFCDVNHLVRAKFRRKLQLVC